MQEEKKTLAANWELAPETKTPTLSWQPHAKTHPVRPYPRQVLPADLASAPTRPISPIRVHWLGRLLPI